MLEQYDSSEMSSRSDRWLQGGDGTLSRVGPDHLPVCYGDGQNWYESPWMMMFSEEILICGESREQVEENMERFRYVVERRGMEGSHSKTDYVCVNKREASGLVKVHGIYPESGLTRSSVW